MKLTEMVVTDFMSKLASNAPAPGGGAAAAIASSIGNALSMMVCNLTVGKEKYKEYEQLCNETLEKCDTLQKTLVDLTDRDADVYNIVIAAYGLPKDTDEQKAKRSEEIQNTLKEAAKVPFELMEKSYEALKITETLIGKTNKNADSDLAVSAIMLKAGIQGANMNVLINLGSIKDSAFVEEYKSKSETILKEAEQLSDKIYNEILKGYLV